MLCNIIDKRTNTYATKADIVLEPSCHDNSIKDSTHYPRDCDFTIEEYFSKEISEIVDIAHKKTGSVTMYIYDNGANTIKRNLNVDS